MRMRIHKQDDQSACTDTVAVGERLRLRRPDDLVVIDDEDDDDDDDDDFEICTKPCVAADFASDREYRRHMPRHVRPLSVQLPRIDLGEYERLPHRVDAFSLIEKPKPKPMPMPATLKSDSSIVVGGFRVELTNYTRLSQDFTYKTVIRIVDPGLLEPVVSMWTPAADLRAGSGRASGIRIPSGIRVGDIRFGGRRNNDSVRARQPPPPSPSPAAEPAATSHQRHYRHSSASTTAADALENLATTHRVPLDDVHHLLRSFGSSHFLLDSPASHFLPTPPPPKNSKARTKQPVKKARAGVASAATSKQAAPVKKPSSDVVVLQKPDGSGPMFGETAIAVALTAGTLESRSSAGAAIVTHPTGGTSPSSTLPAFILTSASSASGAVGKSLMAVATSERDPSSNTIPISAAPAPSTRPISATNSTPGVVSVIRIASSVSVANRAPSVSSSDPIQRGWYSSPVAPLPRSHAVLSADAASITASTSLVSRSNQSPRYRIPNAGPKRSNQNDASKLNGVANLTIIKRVPLSVRQPSHSERVPVEPKTTKERSAPPSPVFVSVGHDFSPLSNGDDTSINEVIDLLSDDENDRCQNRVDDDRQDPPNGQTQDIEIIELE